MKEAKRDVFTGRIRFPRGWDGMSIADFERDRERNLQAIRRKALAGTYTFRPFLSKDVPKTGGGSRTISYGTVRDSIVQRALHRVLAPAVEAQLTSAAFAYRKGCDTHAAIERLFNVTQSGSPWVFESDLRAFFDTLEHTRLQALLSGLAIDERAKTLIWRFIRTGSINTESIDAAQKKRPIPPRRAKGVPQGGVLSGTLANLYLVEFDRKLLSEGIQLVRYADDFILMAATEEAAIVAGSVAEGAVQEIGLALHPGKTKVVHINNGLNFLGFRIRGTRVSVRPANVEKYKQRIRDGISGFTTQILESGRHPEERDLHELVRRLNLKVSGVIKDDDTLSWLRYFRIINDVAQLREIDRFVTRECQRWARGWLALETNRQGLQRIGRRHLVTEYWKLRRNIQTRRLTFSGFVALSGETIHLIPRAETEDSANLPHLP